MFDKKNVLQHVHPARREFLQRLLAGAAFAAPVIATFSIDGLTAESAYAGPGNTTIPNITAPGNQTCGDVGYAGPLQFNAHVSVQGNRLGLLGLAGPSGQRRVNGEVQIQLNSIGDGIHGVTHMNGTITLVSGATLVSATLMVGGRVAAHLVLSGGAFTLTDSNIVVGVACDLDELADFMASGEGSMTVDCTYGGMSYDLSGPLVGYPNVPTPV